MRFTIDPHYVSALMGSEIACEIIDVLPENDLVIELANVMSEQYEILHCLLDGKHYGTDRLNEYMERINRLKDQIKTLKQSLSEEV